MRDTPISESADSLQRKRAFLHAYYEVLPGIVLSPATWFFAVVYLLAACIYVMSGENIASLLFFAARFLIYLLFLLLIIPLTAGATVTSWCADRSSAPSLRKQMLLIVFFLLLGILTSLALFFPWVYAGIGPVLRSFFADWTRLIAWFLIIMVVLPVGGMLLLGVRWREMGFGRGSHAWRVLLLMCGLPVTILVVSLLVGWQTPSSAASRVWEMLPGIGPLIFHALLGVALLEEIFYRGILLTCLVRLLGVRWGSVLSVLIFALVHVPLTMSHMQLAGLGGLFFAVSVCILVQGTAGLILTVIFLRTRNLLVGMVVHAMLDVLPF